MKNRLWILLISIFAYCCSSQHFIKHSDSYYRGLNEKLKGEKVSIIQKNGIEYVGEFNKLTCDSIYWIESNNESYRSIPTLIVNKIVYNEQGGALKGFGFGALSGFAVSAFIGLLAYDPSDTGFMTPSSRGESALWSGTFLGVIGSLFGLFIGATQNNEYIINTSEYSDSGRRIHIVNRNDDPSIQVEISEIVESVKEYIVVLWQEKRVRLSKSEYIHRIKTADGKEYIVVPEEIYESKFQK